MVAAGSGTILVTGNTSALRGRANFAGFAPTKAAQRILAEAMARELGPKGVHVAYLVIDAVIDVPWHGSPRFMRHYARSRARGFKMTRKPR
jgi:short-subunit dehydrogenase